MNRQGLIDAAMQLAVGIGGDAQNSPVVNGEMTMDDLLNHAADYAADILMSNPYGLQQCGIAHAISLSGSLGLYVGTLPDNVLMEHLNSAYLPDYPFASLMEYMDLKRQTFSNLLKSWAIHNGMLYFTGNVSEVVLFAASTPSIPDNPNTEILMTIDFRDKWIEVLASALRGEIRFIS